MVNTGVKVNMSVSNPQEVKIDKLFHLLAIFFFGSLFLILSALSFIYSSNYHFLKYLYPALLYLAGGA
jgi:intracellular septation protein A